MILWNEIKHSMSAHLGSCVSEDGAQLTYEQMCVFAERFAERLNERAYAILCRSEMASAMAMLACIAAGRTAIPIPVRYGKELYTRILERVAPPAVITDVCGELTVISTRDPKPFSDAESSAAVILFTSGSTGKPKGVMLSEKNLLSNARDISAYIGITDKDRILISRPLYHASVLSGEFIAGLLCGADIVFSSQAFSPIALLQIIRERNISVMGTTPTLAAAMARFSHRGGPHSLRKLSISGERVNESVARTIRAGFPNTEIWCGYGLSEASPRVAYLPCSLFDTVPTCAGIALPSVDIRIVDGELRDVKRGRSGQVLVKGEGVMLGYFRDSERSARTVRNGWLCTGDIGFIGEDGMLYIKGRADDMIIRAGMNIYPAEIEGALCSDERVDELLVYGYDDGETQSIGIRVRGRFGSTDEVARLCAQRLPSYQMPSKIELTDEFEMGVSGKKKRYTEGSEAA